MINWIEITKDNWETVKKTNIENGFCGFDYQHFTSEKYVFLTSGNEIVNQARIAPVLSDKYFCVSHYMGHGVPIDKHTITHFALRSEYETVLPSVQKHREL